MKMEVKGPTKRHYTSIILHGITSRRTVISNKTHSRDEMLDGRGQSFTTSEKTLTVKCLSVHRLHLPYSPKMVCALKRVLYSLFTCTSLLANAKPTDRLQWNLEIGFCISCRPDFTVAKSNSKIANSKLNIYRAISLTGTYWLSLPVVSFMVLIYIKTLKNKRPTWCHFLFYFTSYVLNMFWTLIYPSSGACDCVVELPHRSSCSQFVVCWRFGAAGFESCPCCSLKQPRYAKEILKVFLCQ